jgi:aspartyl-tRNA synthetase
MWLSYRTSNSRDAKLLEDNTNVRLIGWIASKREHGKKVFISLRDRYGYIQLVASKEELPEDVFKSVKESHLEAAIAVGDPF